MAGMTTEFKVGLLTLLAVAAAVWGVLRTDDRPDGALAGYELTAWFPSAEGIYPSTQARVAGVSVGSVRAISLDDGRAKVSIEMTGGVKLPKDSVAELKSEGVLGDRFVRITPGASDELLGPGDTLESMAAGADLDQLQAQVSDIAEDVKAITGALREVVENGDTRDQLYRTLDNVEAISAEMRTLTSVNRQNLDVIATNLRDVSASLSTIVASTGAGIDAELDAVREATAKLDRALANIESITGRIDAGEGTLAGLLADDSPLTSLNDTLYQVQDAVDAVTRVRTEVFYRGHYFMGTDPDEPGFQENPLAGRARNVIGLQLKPREDYWYLVEIVDHPTGDVTYEEHVLPASGVSYTEYVRTPAYRYTLQFCKRWQDLVLRLGIKESAGGVGLDYYFLRDRAMLTADFYDMEFGSWPVLDNTPNVSFAARVSPYPQVYIEAGLDNALLGLRHDYITGFIGGGFTFTDDDLKWVLGSLPIPN